MNKLVRGRFAEQVRSVCESALKNGCLVPLYSDEHFFEDGTVSVQLRIMKRLEEKFSATKTQVKEKRNPFLPPEEELTVCDLSDEHLIILNKFAVLEEHSLIITKEFVEQTRPLKRNDFKAIHFLLQEQNGFVFFNSGAIAGASQPHKHIQFVPLPLSKQSGADTPISHLFEGGLDHSIFKEPYGHLSYFNFLHVAALFSDYQVDLENETFINEYADRDYSIYCSILEQLGRCLPEQPKENGLYVGPYNFLMTRKWLMIVPRKEEFFNGISVNSIGFAGGILVKNEEQFQVVKETGFVHLLQELTFPLPDCN